MPPFLMCDVPGLLLAGLGGQNLSHLVPRWGALEWPQLLSAVTLSFHALAPCATVPSEGVPESRLVPFPMSSAQSPEHLWSKRVVAEWPWNISE